MPGTREAQAADKKVNNYTSWPRYKEVCVHPYACMYTHVHMCTHSDSLIFMTILSLKLRQAHGESPCCLYEMHGHTFHYIHPTLTRICCKCSVCGLT